MIRYARNDIAGASKYLGASVDPEVAPDEALIALATTELRNAQPQKLLDLIPPEQRAKLKSPQLKTLIGIALLDTGKTQDGEALIAQALAQQTDSRATTILLAQHHLAKHQAPKAIELLQAELAKHPQDVDVTRLLISAYLNNGAKDQAIRTAQALADRQPPNAENYAVLGRIALQTKQYDVSANALQKALTLNPTLSAAAFDLAQLRLLQQQPAAAETLFQQVLQTDGDNIAALKGLITAREMAQGRGATDIEQLLLGGGDTAANRRAVVAEYYARNRRLDDAERLLGQIDTTAPQSRQYIDQVRRQIAAERANAAVAAGDTTAARTALLQALQAEPGNPPLMAQLARLELRAGNGAEAEKIAAQLAATQPGSALLAELQGDIASAAGQPAAAIARYREAWQRDADNGVGAKLYTALQRDGGTGAAEFIAQWQNAQPYNPTPLLLQGIVLERQGDKAGAVRAYETGLTRDANHAGLLNNLALLYLQQGDARALKLAERAYRLQPKNPAVLDSYGWILVKSGDARKGLELLQQAKALAPNAAEIDAHIKAAQAL
jgi:tetratricopeptide (TPR) repeat protein